jgi:PAS domain S-box-containing protein
MSSPGTSSTAEAPGSAAGRASTIAGRLLLLVFAIIVPLLVLAGVVALLYADAERRLIEASRGNVVRNAVEIVDGRVGEIVSMLSLLAVSPHLQDGNVAAFHRHVLAAAKLTGESIVLIDRNGERLVSTRSEPGAPLPRLHDTSPFAGIFAGTAVVVSDVQTGSLSQAPHVLVSVPVQREGAVPYALTSSLSASALSGVLAEAGLRPEWIAGIVDRQGLFVARSRDPQMFVGRSARPELVRAARGDAPEGTFSNVTLEGLLVGNAFRRSPLTGWTVVIGVPQALLQAPLQRALWTISGIGAVLLLLSLGLAVMASRRIAQPARALADAALALADGSYRPWRQGRIREFNQVGYTLDQAARLMQERDQASAELQHTSALLRTIVETIPDLIYVKDRDSRHILSNPATLAAIGRAGDEVRGRNESSWHIDAAEAAAIIANDRAVIESGEPIQVEEALTTPAGKRIFLSTKAPLRDAAGAVVGVVGVSTDITERKAQEEHLEFLMRELSHRSKNLLTVVQAIAQQTARNSRGVQDFNHAFQGRLGALASLHDLLIRQEWSGAEIHALIEAQLGPFAVDPLRLDAAGPRLVLTPQAAQTIALAVHELATNAAKYGAWSLPSGKVRLRWMTAGEAADERFVMTWVETGGPPVAKPQRRGFGSVVLERMATHGAKNATLALDFPPQGVHWRMEVPASDVLKR